MPTSARPRGSNTMRVLLIEASGRGFLSHYSHALGMGLQRAGLEVRLLTGRRDELRDWPIPFRKHACLDVGYRAWRCIRNYVSEVKPDIVHLQWVDNPLHALRFVRWAQARGVRVVYTPHNILPHERRWLLMPLYRLLYRCLDQVVARDAHLAWALEELLDTPQERVAHLPGSPNFLAMQSRDSEQASLLPRTPDERLRLLFFGHGSARKGLDSLLSALSERQWSVDTHLLIAGEDVTHSVAPELLARARESIRISVLDRYVAPDEVAVLFRDADLLLMPYNKQCKSPLLDLASALRLPVLRSDRVQGADFREGVHGVTFPHDDPQALRGWLNETAWLERVKKQLESLDDPFVSMDRLAAGHMRLYQHLKASHALSAADGLTAEAPLLTSK